MLLCWKILNFEILCSSRKYKNEKKCKETAATEKRKRKGLLKKEKGGREMDNKSWWMNGHESKCSTFCLLHLQISYQNLWVFSVNWSKGSVHDPTIESEERVISHKFLETARDHETQKRIRDLFRVNSDNPLWRAVFCG